MWLSNFNKRKYVIGALALSISILLNVLPKTAFAHHHNTTSNNTTVESHNPDRIDFNKFLSIETDVDSDFEIEVEEQQTYLANLSVDYYFNLGISESLQSKHISNLFNRVSIPLFVLHHSWRSDIC